MRTIKKSNKSLFALSLSLSLSLSPATPNEGGLGRGALWYYYYEKRAVGKFVNTRVPFYFEFFFWDFDF